MLLFNLWFCFKTGHVHCPQSFVPDGVTVVGHRGKVQSYPSSSGERQLSNVFLLLFFFFLSTGIFALKNISSLKGRGGGRHAHLRSVTHIEDSFSFNKSTKKLVEQAVTHSNTKRCGEMNKTDAKRVQACFYTVRGTVSICHSFRHNYFTRSLLVCTIQGFSSRTYSALLLYLITGLLGVCIMVV